MPDTSEKKRDRRKELREKDPKAASTKYHDQNLKHKFGIGVKEYRKMFEDQGGCCAICERHQSQFQRRMAVDHCHNTGKIRGLLCQSCNSGMGKLNDDPYYLEAAINYLANGPRFLTKVARQPAPHVVEVT